MYPRERFSRGSQWRHDMTTPTHPTAPHGAPTAVIGERTELPKPVKRVPEIADPALHRQLRAALKKHFGMRDHAAGAVSTMFVDPAEVLVQCEKPIRRRVPGGHLLVLAGQVYTGRLAADPFNPRNSDSVIFPL